jgi:formiminotetrahydrofolate cyclodeaminase
MDQLNLDAVHDGWLDQPASTLLAAFGAGKAVPGSGSAAALMGLLAARLLITVCNKSLEKTGNTTKRAQLEYFRQQAHAMEPVLTGLFENDARMFEQVVHLRKTRDQTTDASQRAALAKQANDALEGATDNVFAVIEPCMKLVDHGVGAFNIGWEAIRGDSGAAISAAIAGVMSALFIINVNLKTLRDRKYAKDNIERCAKAYADLQAKQVQAFTCVTSLSAEALEAIQLDLPATRP